MLGLIASGPRPYLMSKNVVTVYQNYTDTAWTSRTWTITLNLSTPRKVFGGGGTLTGLGCEAHEIGRTLRSNRRETTTRGEGPGLTGAGRGTIGRPVREKTGGGRLSFVDTVAIWCGMCCSIPTTEGFDNGFRCVGGPSGRRFGVWASTRRCTSNG